MLFLVGLSWGGTSYPWTSGETLGTLISGIFTLVAFVVYDAADPVAPRFLVNPLSFTPTLLSPAPSVALEADHSPTAVELPSQVRKIPLNRVPPFAFIFPVLYYLYSSNEYASFP